MTVSLEMVAWWDQNFYAHPEWWGLLHVSYINRPSLNLGFLKTCMWKGPVHSLWNVPILRWSHSMVSCLNFVILLLLAGLVHETLSPSDTRDSISSPGSHFFLIRIKVKVMCEGASRVLSGRRGLLERGCGVVLGRGKKHRSRRGANRTLTAMRQVCLVLAGPCSTSSLQFGCLATT